MGNKNDVNLWRDSERETGTQEYGKRSAQQLSRHCFSGASSSSLKLSFQPQSSSMFTSSTRRREHKGSCLLVPYRFVNVTRLAAILSKTLTLRSRVTTQSDQSPFSIVGKEDRVEGVRLHYTAAMSSVRRMLIAASSLARYRKTYGRRMVVTPAPESHDRQYGFR